jgi:prepilin-type N-terminal cleavage/methylation domain-containing protein
MNAISNRVTVRCGARKGLSLIELMISLSISVMLLVAAGTAFNASAQAVQMNDRFFRASQASRVTMNQLLTEVRRCDSVAVSSTYVDVIRPMEDLTTGEIYRRFAYDATNKRITIQIFQAGGVGGTIYTLASNVSAATFGPAEMVKDANQAWVVVRVPISITVTVGSNDITLNGAAAPRRAQKA